VSHREAKFNLLVTNIICGSCLCGVKSQEGEGQGGGREKGVFFGWTLKVAGLATSGAGKVSRSPQAGFVVRFSVEVRAFLLPTFTCT
jgi:hypothetical protein